MKIKFNNNTIDLTQYKKLNLLEILELNDYKSGCYAVMINNVFVPKSNYSTKEINDNDQIDIILPMQGG